MPPSTVFDIIALILIGWLTVRGLMRGVVAQVASIASVVVSWIIAVKFSPIVAPMVSDDPPWNKLIAMLVLFVASSIAIWLIRGLLEDLLKMIRLKTADRSLGAVLGLAKGILLCSILTFFLVVFSPSSRNFVLGSVSGKYFAYGIERVTVLIPEDVNVVLTKNLEGFRESLDEKFGPDGIPLDDLGTGSLRHLAEEVYDDIKARETGKFSEQIKEGIDRVKSEISSVLSLKDIESKTTLPSSSLQEKAGTTSAVSPTSSEPSAPYTGQTSSPRRTVLPFQPSR